MSDTLFSIIIPTYNSAATIAGCLESILVQSFVNWEVLIIDGVSKDNTVAIAEDYAKKHPPIRVVSEKDSGIYDAMNKGINLSNGKWLYFLGCDDKLYTESVLADISQEISLLTGEEILYGNVFSERFNGLYDGAFNFSKILESNISHQAIFFKKSLFEKTGYFDLKYRAQSDWDHNLKWLLAADIKNRFINMVVAYYADGGFSSVNGDDTFYRDLRINYLTYGQRTLPLWKKILVSGFEFLKLIKRGDKKRLAILLKVISNKT